MRKWAVIYSSTTGNTKAIAEEIAGTAGADLFRVQDAPADLSAYEVVALGYWLRRGGPDDLMKAYLPKVRN
ncbi:MAG: flavodoxin family protein, partial [Centipeda sp. (in: firmicutes)]